MAATPATVDDYLAALPETSRRQIEHLLAAVRRAVPHAGDKISYGIPTITHDGTAIVHVAAWKHHVSMYPIPDADEALQRDLAPYVAGKGTLRFPLDEPLPVELVERVAAALMAQHAVR
jgi:uncharacterized protein YdhG (YjbR/CyaY superfamily)